MSEHISDERLRNTRNWAAARVGDMSGAEVIVGAIDEVLERRQLDRDLLLCGESFRLTKADGTVVRIDPSRVDIRPAEQPACICRPVGAGDGDTYAINPACPEHGTHGSAPVRAYHVTRYPHVEPARTIDNVTECYIFASSGYVNTARRGGAYTSQHPYETATVTLNVGQRMIVERVDQGVMRLEVLP